MTTHDKDAILVFVVVDGTGFPVEVFEDEREAGLFAAMESHSTNMHRVQRLAMHFKDRSRNAEAQSYYL